MGRYKDYDNYYGWAPYVPVAQRRANAQSEMKKLCKKGMEVQPIEPIQGRSIARTFWGKGWCDHLESFSDYENRLPRGRTYVRNGSVCHLDIANGKIEAYVSGSELYKVTIRISPLKAEVWNEVKNQCRGQIGSMLELLQGRVSDSVMRVVSDRDKGLFPRPGEIELKCSCPDIARMCKHVAAVLYGVGTRLDARPELLFVLRNVKAEELIAAAPALPATGAVTGKPSLPAGSLSAIFDIDLEDEPEEVPAEKPVKASAVKKAKGKTATGKTKAATPPKSKPAPPPPPLFDPAAPTGAGIAVLRQQTGLSVAGFALTLKVSPASVQRWEATPGPLRLQSEPLAALKRLQKRINRSK